MIFYHGRYVGRIHAFDHRIGFDWVQSTPWTDRNHGWQSQSHFYLLHADHPEVVIVCPD